MLPISFTLQVSDLKKSSVFYTQFLGQPSRSNTSQSVAFLLAKNVTLVLVLADTMLAPKTISTNRKNAVSRTHLELTCSNVYVCMQKGRSLGGIEVDALQKRKSGKWIGYLADLDGHILALAEANPEKYKRRRVKALRGDRKIVFDKGSFDDWCVFVVEANGQQKAPFDVAYFTDLKQIAIDYPSDKVYNDFVAIFDWTDKTIDQQVLKLIDTIIGTYLPKHQGLMEQWLTVLYAGMIAEENKEFAILKKRIKRLGMHQILKLDFLPETAANFSKGKKWRTLDTIMTAFGF